MANVMINDTNLTNIANAIRDKNGTVDTYKPSEMAAAILAIEAGGGDSYVPTAEDLTYSITEFKANNNAWVLNEYGDRITLVKNDDIGSYFENCSFEHFDKNLTLGATITLLSLTNCFANCNSLKDITAQFKIVGNSNNQIYLYKADAMFYSCYQLRSINDNLFDGSYIKWFNTTNSSYNRFLNAFSECYSLREIPTFYFKMLTANGQPKINDYLYSYTNMFKYCYTLNKIENLPVVSQRNNGLAIADNMFGNTFACLYNLSKLTFQTNEDGSPLTANWTGQVINLHRTTASPGYLMSGRNATTITGYNSGLTAEDEIDKETGVNPDTQYYLGDGINNHWTANLHLAKYGHTEAVETLNSLPDTSAAGGGNTITFYGKQGWYTDYLKGRTNDNTFDSRIQNLTEAEIAVAAAKGWTVSIYTT